MRIKNKFITLVMVWFLNQYNMEKNNNIIGLFSLSVDENIDYELGRIPKPLFPGMIVQDSNRNIDDKIDFENFKSKKEANLLTGNVVKKIVEYPLNTKKSGSSGGLAYYLSQAYYESLPIYDNTTHRYNINRGIFATGVLCLDEKNKVTEIGGLYFKLKGLDLFLSNTGGLLSICSCLLLPEDNEMEYCVLREAVKFKCLPKLLFISDLSQVECMIQQISTMENQIEINTQKSIKTIYPKYQDQKGMNRLNEEIENELIKILTLICVKINTMKDCNDSQILKHINLFLNYYDYHISLFTNKSYEIIYNTLFPFLLSKLTNNIDYFVQFLEIIHRLFTNSAISIEHKKLLTNSLRPFIQKKIDSKDNDFLSLRLMYEMIDNLSSNLQKCKNVEYQTLNEELQALVTLLIPHLSYMKKIIEYKKKFENIKIDTEKTKEYFEEIINNYLILFTNEQLEEIRTKKSKEKESDTTFLSYSSNEFSNDYLKLIRNKEIALNKLLNELKHEYNNDDLFKLLNSRYGINTFESEIPASDFFEQFEKKGIFERENIFLVFTYLDNSIEKGIFELDNPEFKAAWKDFILKWVQQNSSFEPLALLLTNYCFMKYKAIKEDDKKAKEKKNFYCNLFSDVVIYNKFNEPLLQYLIDITKNYQNELQDFFKKIVERGHQIDNDYIKKYLFDSIFEKIEKNTLHFSLYEGFAILFFTFPIKLQDWYIDNKLNNMKYPLCALIKFIYIQNQKDNNLFSLHPKILISCDWLVLNEKLTVLQATLAKLLKMLENISDIKEADLKEIKSYYYNNYWPSDDDYEHSSHYLIAPLQEYPQFLGLLLKYVIKNNKDIKTYEWIEKKLEDKRNHYREQIEIAEKCGNNYIKWYESCLNEIETILQNNKQNKLYKEEPLTSGETSEKKLENDVKLENKKNEKNIDSKNTLPIIKAEKYTENNVVALYHKLKNKYSHIMNCKHSFEYLQSMLNVFLLEQKICLTLYKAQELSYGIRNGCYNERMEKLKTILNNKNKSIDDFFIFFETEASES